ncbi:MAG TPA: VWA domain-containing protein [Bryobacteraceae bacterium]|nr:VWA domain-containing protein [Bryobacteraceae bacterium]
MIRSACLLPFALAWGVLLPGAAAQEPIVFRSDVALVRVDTQVLDRENRAITGLHVEDFILRDNGEIRQISNFASEEMPVDILLLLDVSGSMRSHVERIASAAHQALQVLGEGDRVAIMVFDRASRLRLPFRANRSEVERAFEALLSQETFNGGTDITRALLDAAAYVGREGRRDARRAVVILTDDQTERGRDVDGTTRALENADAVLSALIAPDAMRSGSRMPGGMGGPIPGRTGGGWPDIILGNPYPGRRMPGPVVIGPHTSSAGTVEIARRTGGDTLRVDEASAFEWTLARIRQRYALHYHLPEAAQPGRERNIQVELADAARRRYPNAEVRFRRVNLGGGGTGTPEPTLVSQAPTTQAPTTRRRRGVDESHGTSGPVEQRAEASPPAEGGWRRVEEPPRAAEPAQPAQQSAPAEGGGWRRLKPGEQP